MGVKERMGLSDSVYMTRLITKLGTAKHELISAIMTRDWKIACLKSLKNAKLYPHLTKEDQARRMLRESLDFGINYSIRDALPLYITPFPVLDYPSQL
jgi:hypothetical protein